MGSGVLTLEDYRGLVLDALCEYGATDEELDLVTDEVILSGYRNGPRSPRDIAWALLQ